jgi:hypothetical protein
MSIPVRRVRHLVALTTVRQSSATAVRAAISLALICVLAGPTLAQPEMPPTTCPDQPRPPAASTAADTTHRLSPPILSADNPIVWYIPHAASTDSDTAAFQPLRAQVVPGAVPTQTNPEDGVSVENRGVALLSFPDPALNNQVAWLVRIFQDSQANLCVQASLDPDAPRLVFISLAIGAILGGPTPATVAGTNVEVRTDYAVIAMKSPPAAPAEEPATPDDMTAAQASPDAAVPELFAYQQPNVATWVVALNGTFTVSTPGCNTDMDNACHVDVASGQQTFVQPNQSPSPPVAASSTNIPPALALPSMNQATGCGSSASSMPLTDLFGGAPPSDCSTPTPTPTPTPTSTPTPTPTPVPTPPTPGPPSHDFFYGAMVAGLDHAGKLPAAGFSHMWAFVAWSTVVGQKSGEFKFNPSSGSVIPNDLTNVLTAARNDHLKVVLRLDSPPGGSVSGLSPGDVQTYVNAAVKYGMDVIDYVEVFNEVNRPDQWGGSPNPRGYVQLLAAAYAGAKAANPNVVVLSAAPTQRTGGLGGTMEDVDWLEQLYAAGGQQYFDMLGMHAYLGTTDPALSVDACDGLCFQDIERYRAVMTRHGDNRQAVITEMGALEQTATPLGPYFEWMKLDADTRASYLVRALEFGASSRYPWLRGAIIQNLDFATPGAPARAEQPWFALLDSNLLARTAFTRIQQAHDSHAI